jgi:hypothetical protein
MQKINMGGVQILMRTEEGMLVIAEEGLQQPLRENNTYRQSQNTFD